MIKPDSGKSIVSKVTFEKHSNDNFISEKGK